MTVEEMFEKFLQRVGLEGVPAKHLDDVRSVFHFGVLECIGAQTAVMKADPRANLSSVMGEWISEIAAYSKARKEDASAKA